MSQLQPWIQRRPNKFSSVARIEHKKLGLTIVLITHEMQIVKDIANRVAVMQNGELIEEGSVLDIFSNPKNALTQDFITVANRNRWNHGKNQSTSDC